MLENAFWYFLNLMLSLIIFEISGRFNEYTGGMSEEEQVWRATQRSLYEQGWRLSLF